MQSIATCKKPSRAHILTAVIIATFHVRVAEHGLRESVTARLPVAS